MSDTATVEKTAKVMVSVEKGQTLFAALRWVLAARSPDDTRYFMNGLHVETEGNGYLWVATDGRRLHKATVSFDLLQPGEYKVVSETNKAIVLEGGQDFQFPNWRRVVPTSPITETVQALFFGVDRARESHPRGRHQSMWRLFRSAPAMNLDYLADLGPLGDVDADLRADDARDSGFMPVCFRGRIAAADALAVVMPMGEIDDAEVLRRLGSNKK